MRNLKFVLEATLCGARGPHVRLIHGLNAPSKNPTSPGDPAPCFTPAWGARERPKGLIRKIYAASRQVQPLSGVALAKVCTYGYTS